MDKTLQYTKMKPGNILRFEKEEIHFQHDLSGGFKDFSFSPLPGEMIQFDYYFSKGLKRPTSDACSTAMLVYRGVSVSCGVLM